MSRKHFEHEAPFWKEVYSSDTIERAIYGARQSRMLALANGLGLRAGASVLEVGCGAGITAVELARRGYRVYASDFVETMLTMTAELAVSNGVSRQVRTVCSDAQRLPFRDGCFDLAVGSAVLEWLDEPELGMAEIARVLKPGGSAIFSATNAWGLHRLIDPGLSPALEPFKRRGGSERARAHTRRELSRLIETAHLRQDIAITTGYGPFTFLKFKLFPGARGVRIHEALEKMARNGARLLRDSGYAHVFMATKEATGLERKRNAELN